MTLKLDDVIEFFGKVLSEVDRVAKEIAEHEIEKLCWSIKNSTGLDDQLSDSAKEEIHRRAKENRRSWFHGKLTGTGFG